MKINYIQGIILIVLACVLHTNSAKPKKSLENASTKDPSKEKKDDIENMLLNIATLIQRSVDNRTMNNKNFKTTLDNIYNDLVKPKLKDIIEKQLIKVKKIEKKIEKDFEVFKIMTSMSDDKSSKNKQKLSKKPSKK